MKVIGTKDTTLPRIEGQDESEDIKVIGYVQPFIDEAIVLVERRNSPRAGVEYVVWRVNLYDMSLHSGFYTMDRADALRTFAYRIGARPE